MAQDDKDFGYTNIAHAILEKLASLNLSGSEFQVIMVVMRKTYGWKKESDVIPLSQFQRLTGLPRWTVWTAIEKLVSKSLLVRKSLLAGSEYRLNKDLEAWHGSKQKLTSKEKLTSASKEKPTKLVSKSLHSKENQKQPLNPLPPKGDNGFDSFWKDYPRHDAKATALKTWQKLNPSPELLDTILKSLETQKQNPQWLKENGQFIPLPATWLNGRRWEDEGPQIKDWREW